MYASSKRISMTEASEGRLVPAHVLEQPGLAAELEEQAQPPLPALEYENFDRLHAITGFAAASWNGWHGSAP